MEKLWVIYLLICIPLEMGYVGQTCQTIENRCLYGKGYKPGTKIRQAFDEYGPDNFVCFILEEGITSKEKADERERHWIETLGTVEYGLNLEGGGTSGKIVNESTKQKFSEIHKGLTLTDECKKKIGDATRGKSKGPYPPFSEEHRKRISEGKKGVLHSEETKIKMRDSSPRKRPVRKYDLNGNFLDEYPSAREAARKNKIKGATTISAVCRGNSRYKSCGGFIWKYVD